jgi:phosphoribosylanthranilate isomerase
VNKVRVKICGITREEDLTVVLDAGADAVGFVVGVPSSPRNISLEKAEKLVKLVPIFAKSVLVTVPTHMDALLKTCEKLGPNVLQIHGENLINASKLREKLPNTSLIEAVNSVQIALQASKSFDAILFDSFVDGKQGGTGIVHDWNLSKRAKQVIHPKPLILAGGLNPRNVKDAVSIVKPYAVDVSSGVEAQPGIKDRGKVMEFIRNAKEAKI